MEVCWNGQAKDFDRGMIEDERRGELEDVGDSSGLDANILEFDDGSLAPFESQVIKIEFIGVEEVKSGE